MKKLKYIIAIAIVVLIAIISIIIVKPYKRYRKGVIEKEIVELLNAGKIGKDILESDKELYNYARHETNNYNVDEFVDWYIDFIEKIIEIKQSGTGTENLKDFRFSKKEFSDIEGFGDKNIYKEIINHIKDKDIERYNDGTLRNYLIQKLKEIFNHVGKDDNRGWSLNRKAGSKIELLYGEYLKFTPTDKKSYTDFSKALKANIYEVSIVSGKIKKDKPILYYIDDLHNEDYVYFKCEITYQSDKKETKTATGNIQLDNKTGELKYSTALLLNDMFFEQTHYASIELCHHDIDKRKEEERRREEEMLKSKEDDAMHPEEILVDTKIKRIEMFKKYNQFAEIIVVTYKDDSKKSFFRKSSDFITEEGKKHVEYMERELPYKNKSIDEVMELYINDKEQYSVDEELLRGNPPLVEYKVY